MAGIVTLDDLLSEIIGEIKDEHDDDSGDFTMINDREAPIRGSMSVVDFARQFGIELDTEDADTVAGYIIERLGYIPQQTAQELISTDDFSFTVVEATGTRIETILMKLKHPLTPPR